MPFNKFAAFGALPQRAGTAAPGAQTLRGKLDRHTQLLNAAQAKTTRALADIDQTLRQRPVPPPALPAPVPAPGVPANTAFLIGRCLNSAESAVCDLRNATLATTNAQLARHRATKCYAASLAYLRNNGHAALAVQFDAAFAPLSARGRLMTVKRERFGQIAALKTAVLGTVVDGADAAALVRACVPAAKPAAAKKSPRRAAAAANH